MAIEIIEQTKHLISYYNLWQAREQSGLSQEKFGNIMGWSQQNQNKIETRALTAPEMVHILEVQQVKALKSILTNLTITTK